MQTYRNEEIEESLKSMLLNPQYRRSQDWRKSGDIRKMVVKGVIERTLLGKLIWDLKMSGITGERRRLTEGRNPSKTCDQNFKVNYEQKITGLRAETGQHTQGIDLRDVA